MRKNDLSYLCYPVIFKTKKIAQDCGEGYDPYETLQAKAERCLKIAQYFGLKEDEMKSGLNS